MKQSLLLISSAIVVAVGAVAQQPPSPQARAGAPATQSTSIAPRPEVLVLGTYHMANPGHDIYNVKADDVLAPKRQAEIAQLIEVLKKFRPTKIGIESDAGDDRIPKRYADYLAGKYELSRNEIDQIGLRLAKELGHKTIYPVDAEVDFPYQRLLDYAKGIGRSKDLEQVMGEFGSRAKAENDYLASHTVLETLLYINTDSEVAYSNGLYAQLAHFGQPDDWAGADLNAEWFRRNVRIFSNITQLVDSPNDRILVIFGAGHLGWLRHEVSTDPTLKLRKLGEFVK